MPWPIIAQLLVSAVTAAVSYAMQEKPSDALDSTKERPTSQDGMIIPWAFGTVTVRGVNCLWYGDVSTHEIIANGGK